MCSEIFTCLLAARESYDLRSENDPRSVIRPATPNANVRLSSLPKGSGKPYTYSPKNSERFTLRSLRFDGSANVQRKYSNAEGRVARAASQYVYLLKATQEWFSDYSRNLYNMSVPSKLTSRVTHSNLGLPFHSLRKLLARRVVIVPTVLIITSTGTAAMAGSYNSHQTTNPSYVDLELKLFGKIKPRCEIHLSKEKLWFEMTDDASLRSLPFDINCNQPLKIEVSSRNGGLEHSSHDRIPTYPGFTSFLEYDLDLALQAPGTNNLHFDSEDITNEPGRGHFGAIPHDTKGELQISWTSTETLIAGTYGDVIEIRITGDSGSNVHW